MTQRKVLFFVFDARGLGHLRRMSRIAEGVAGPCAPLILTSQRAVAWIVSSSCAIASIPNHQQLSAVRSARHGAECWLDLSGDAADRLRRRFIDAVVGAFEPDLVVVDYLPLGRREELDGLLETWTARKYLLVRGVIDPHDLVLFEGRGRSAMERDYDRILVTADPRTSELSQSFESVAPKMHHVGYVAPDRCADHVAIRRARGIPSRMPWVVCSAGAGVRSEELIDRCLEAAAAFPGVRFDIVTGPLTGTCLTRETRAHVIHETPDLPQLHAAADVVICHGGYNSLIEAMSGGARVIVHTPSDAWQSERRIHAERLSHYYPITLVHAEHDLIRALDRELTASRFSARPSPVLDTDGVSNIRDIVFADVGLSPSMTLLRERKVRQ